ncbi:uncharacterized protein MYCFIDRAFT_52479 [Pseudocercospora fijiensis CIRAD86]|uniref:Helicase ATP-binding domain-containing protein n=1 Tax=Pseudocercospora fijiensis (strain CIRAD86) TaxID=383855 RepID=M2Z8I2_PSEFD|nr:uncharacterized protein MYCFIDRAFT_52479 [Pseudocercospora fijiensis CIRAD86]EME86095.1 hypothetical protein MYCFIDRAFT_52479 [Pseudocercospora fijiensis CIRAD86]
MQRARCACRDVNIRETLHRQFYSTPAAHFTTSRYFHAAPKWHRAIESTRRELRSYQEDSIQAILNARNDGKQRLGLSLPTGGGKTVVFSHLIDRFPNPNADATQTLILAHRRELVEQAASHCSMLYPDKSVEVEMGQIHASGLADITVASVQSITSKDRLLRYDPDRFKLLLIDEAHHSVSQRYLDVLQHFKLSKNGQRGSTSLVGVTATFTRHDGIRLGEAYDEIVYHKDYLEMIQEGWLSNIAFTTVKTHANLSKVKTQSGDFQAASLSKAVNTAEINSLTVAAWRAKAGEARRSTLVFCVDLDHVEALTAEFRAQGVDAYFVTSDTDKKTRAARLEAFKREEFPVLVNCGIYTEGTDIPNVDCVLLARPTQSRNLLVQMIGRGLRLHSGKTNCHVIDMVASLETGIVTTPTLFGLDPDELVDDAGVTEMTSRKEKKEREAMREKSAMDATVFGAQSRPYTGNVTFTDYDNVTDLIKDDVGDRHIRKISPYSWVQIDDNRYVLSNRNGELIRIQKGEDEETYVVTLTRKLPMGSKSPYARPKQIATAITFEDAVHAADTAASETFPFEFISKTAYWRKTIASNAQIDFLNKFRSKDEKLEYGSIKRGRAADFITKINHGARGRFDRMSQRKRAAERAEEKKDRIKERQEREQVTVGPVNW